MSAKKCTWCKGKGYNYETCDVCLGSKIEIEFVESKNLEDVKVVPPKKCEACGGRGKKDNTCNMCGGLG